MCRRLSPRQRDRLETSTRMWWQVIMKIKMTIKLLQTTARTVILKWRPAGEILLTKPTNLACDWITKLWGFKRKSSTPPKGVCLSVWPSNKLQDNLHVSQNIKSMISFRHVSFHCSSGLTRTRPRALSAVRCDLITTNRFSACPSPYGSSRPLKLCVTLL